MCLLTVIGVAMVVVGMPKGRSEASFWGEGGGGAGGVVLSDYGLEGKRMCFGLLPEDFLSIFICF